MSILRTSIFLFIILCGALCRADDNCDYALATGKEFFFREATDSLQRYGYQQWHNVPKIAGTPLDYEKYSGKKGKIQDVQISDAHGFKWYVAILETCEKVYTAHSEGGLKEIEDHRGICFQESLKRAQTLIGKKIWITQRNVANDQELFTDDPATNYPVDHLEALDVTGVESKLIGHGRGAGPLSLVVRKSTGQSGYIAYNDFYFFEQNPIDPKWDRASIELIKRGGVKLGMSDRQVLLSLGKPNRVNQTVDATGVHEQWVYGGGNYVYFEGKKVTRFQTSE